MRTYFFDTEFTGLRKDTTLISIGIVSDTGDRFYAELTDYNESMCDEWIEKNVLDHLILSGNADLEESMAADNKTTTVIGSKADVRRELMEWLEMDVNFDSDYAAVFVSDVSHYDMVLLIDLLVGNRKGVQLASGQSVTVFKQILQNLGYNPVEAMENTINSERYDCITVE